MKKLSATLVIVTAIVATTTTAAGAVTGNTGSYGPAEEPTWVFPLVALFVLGCAVAAALGVRGQRTKD